MSSFSHKDNGTVTRTITGLLLCVALLLGAGCEGREQLEAIHQRLGTSAEGRILPDREDFYGASVASKDRAYVVGSYGTILAVDDGATKVSLQKSGTHKSLFAVSANGSSSAIIGGERGLLLRTTDGGATWAEVQPPSGVKQNISGFARGKDPKLVWEVAPEGTIIHSADDGATWEDLGLKKDLTLNSATFLDDKEGWIVGEFGSILHTADGGHTWQERTKVSGLPKYVEDVSDEEARHRGIPSLEEQDLYLFQAGFLSPQEGYIVGAGGFALHTTDAGMNWQATHADTRNTLFSLGLPAGSMPVASGILGTLTEKQADGWKLNTEASSTVFTWLRTVAFAPDGSLGIVTGGKGTLLISTDGGKNWGPLNRDLLQAAAGA